MLDYELLLKQNPWWKGKKKLKEDYDIRRWKEKPLNWKPKLVNNINLEPYSLHILVGPRQVGKTTALKLLVRKLLNEKVEDEKSVFYFNCEEIRDYKELIELLKTYFDIREGAGLESSYLILDEVTSVEKWQKGIKSLIDKGDLEKDVIIITGSTSLKIKRETELFAGRRGKGKNHLMLPLSFRRFIEVQDSDLIDKLPQLENLSKKELQEKASQAMPFSQKLMEYLEKYFEYGGLPLSIQALKGGIEKEEAKRAYLDYLKNDILETDRDDQIAREIISVLLTKGPSPLSWRKISQEISIKSPKTVSSYLKLLKELYSLIILNYIDLSSSRLQYGKRKKFHVADPLFLEIFEDWSLTQIKDRNELLAESAVASHLARFERKNLSLGDNLGYWKNGKEIDLIVRGDNPCGFEVKWTDRVRDLEEYKKYGQHLNHLTFVLKSKYSNEPLMIPLAVFLAMI